PRDRAGSEHGLADEHIGRRDRVEKAAVLMLFGRCDRDVEMTAAPLPRLAKGEVGNELGEPGTHLIGGETAGFSAPRRVGKPLAREKRSDLRVLARRDDRRDDRAAARACKDIGKHAFVPERPYHPDMEKKKASR